MKKAIALAMASVMAAGLLAGCGGSAANSTAASSEAASSEAASTSTEAALACSEKSLAYICRRFSVMIISYDKMNQLRHVRFLKNKDGVLQHMAKHRRRLVPCFDAVKTTFAHELTPCGDIAHWTNPKGGYFISLYVMPGCAKRVAQLCKDCGLTLTGAGAAFPYGIDPQDSHLRIAPTYPSLSEVETASMLLTVCVRLAVVEKLLAE